MGRDKKDIDRKWKEIEMRDLLALILTDEMF